MSVCTSGAVVPLLGTAFQHDPDSAFPGCPVMAAKGVFWVNDENGTVRPASCRTTACLHCRRVKVINYIKMIKLTRPQSLVTLTLVGDEWPVVKARMGLLRQNLRRDGVRDFWAWTVERNPSSSGHHIHAHVWGNPVEPHYLGQRARQAGMGHRVHIQHRYDEGGYQYGFKEAVADDPALRSHYLQMNGDRLLHNSQGFWRDGVTGEQLRGDFRSLISDQGVHQSGERSPWHLVNLGQDEVAA